MNNAYKDDTSKARIAKVNRICKAVLKLAEEDFEAIEHMADHQMAYLHPLKLATQGKINDLGVHNRRVSKALRNLHANIKMLKL